MGLAACFGLRPIEIGYVRADGDRLYCWYRKRTARKPQGTEPRHIVGLDPDGLPGLSLNLLAKLREHGDKCLPISCRGEDATGAGQALHLPRTPGHLAGAESGGRRSATRGQHRRALVPYSLRHGFADRADRAGFSRREACLAMGHSSQSHTAYEAPSAATAASSISKANARTRELQQVA